MKAKTLKALKTDLVRISDKSLKFGVECEIYPNARKAEAVYLAKIMTGQYDWNGIRGEITHFSGLAKLANEWLKTSPTTFRITEAIVHGDGQSYYIL